MGFSLFVSSPTTFGFSFGFGFWSGRGFHDLFFHVCLVFGGVCVSSYVELCSGDT